jgi:hypothetical protein
VNIAGGTEQKLSDEAHGNGPAYAFYGDDFTGATDTLAHLARAEPFADHRRDERQRQHGGGEHGCQFAAGLVALAVGG